MLISDGINHNKLQSIIVGELKKAGLKHRLKKIILKNVKDQKTVFGAPLAKVPSCSVICCGSTLCVPMVVTEMSSVLRANAQIEGLFRKAGSQNRQKDIKRLLDAGGCVSDGHHPIDVASVLKLYLRCLPEPLISAEVQDLLLRCKITAGDDALKPILHTLLLLPVLHVHLLHYIMEIFQFNAMKQNKYYNLLNELTKNGYVVSLYAVEMGARGIPAKSLYNLLKDLGLSRSALLNLIASRHKENLMDSSNLAIVLTPSIMPLPAAASAQRLDHHVALVKMFIENSKHIGLLTDDLMTQLDDDSDGSRARRKKRRSGSLNRMLSGLRKMVSGSVNTPATVRENPKTPVLSKSAAKRKFDNQEGFSAKNKKEIAKNLAQKELTYTPMKMGIERKRLRLSLMDARSTPVINSEFSKNSETSISSEDLITSSEQLFSAHDTIDLSPDMKQDKDYVRISKIEYEEIKSRVSAIENRLSREFTDVIPKIQPLQQVQNVYEQTLEDVAMLNCPNSDHLARRLSKELKIRPNEEAKIIRSPSARKIGSIRRRSKENLTKIVRHKSWNVSSQSQSQTSHIADRFYPYIGLGRRQRTSTAKPDLAPPKVQTPNEWDVSMSESMNTSNSNQKYQLRKRISLSDYNPDKTISKIPARRSLNLTVNNSWDNTGSENSMNNTLNSTAKSNTSDHVRRYQNVVNKQSSKLPKPSPTQPQQKWRSAAAFFMDKTGDVENTGQTGRPSVNKLRRNAGAVLAKAKLFESSSDKSSDTTEKTVNTGFARKPRISGQYQNKPQKMVAHVKPREQSNTITARTIPIRTPRSEFENTSSSKLQRVNGYQNKEEMDWRTTRKTTPPFKKVVSPQTNNVTLRTPQIPTLKKPLVTPKSSRLAPLANDVRKTNTPLKAVHVSPRRRSPRQKPQRPYN